MDIRIKPTRLSGRVKAPPSKSAAHRAVLCAALAQGESRIRGVAFSEDIRASIRAARAIGARVDSHEASGTVVIQGVGGGSTPVQGTAEIDCGESGSTLRFFIPVAAALGCKATFTGRGQLPKRPVEPLAREMARHGAVFSRMDGLPLTVEGRLTPGRYEMPGNISSQYITGLLFALALNGGGSTLTLTSPLESAGYVDMTIQALGKAGVTLRRTQDGFFIPDGQKLRAFDLRVEGDYSNAAFWLCADALGCNISCPGLSPDSAQGDKAILDLLLSMGARILTDPDITVNAPGGLLHGRKIDVSAFPDLFPILAVIAAGAKGETVLYNAGRLRIKECDRLAAMAQCLRTLGVKAEENEDRLFIQGMGAPLETPLAGGVTLDGHNDHRIVMAMAVAALLCKEPIIITGAQAVGKSYPDFFDRYRELGGNFDVL